MNQDNVTELAPNLFRREVKNSIFYSQTTSLCESCLKLVPAKIIFEGLNVFYLKRCQEHGEHKTLISTDIDFYKKSREYIKESDLPLRRQTETLRGCPYDCGLCPDHEQHSCLAIIEINDGCNLKCPVCFASSGPEGKFQITQEDFKARIDVLVASEGEPDLLQISGGEPTLHPLFLELLDMARSTPIRHVMVNTNGIRLANDREFVKALAERRKAFEVYLQFDSLHDEALKTIRGANLLSIRMKALAHLEEFNISTTLVVVVKKGVNDHELGAIVDFAKSYRCVRGVTFQPIQSVGRTEEYDQNQNRIVLSEVRQKLIEQSSLFSAEDIIPLPCNPESISIAYALKNGTEFQPMTRLFNDLEFFKGGPNTITYEKHPGLRQALSNLFSLSTSECNNESKVQSLLCCIPQFELPEEVGYDNVFRVVIMQFMDKYNFCLAQVKRSCVHFVTENKKIIPFETYNLFYRSSMRS